MSELGSCFSKAFLVWVVDIFEAYIFLVFTIPDTIPQEEIKDIVIL